METLICVDYSALRPASYFPDFEQGSSAMNPDFIFLVGLPVVFSEL